jgi:hypothetical protein
VGSASLALALEMIAQGQSFLTPRPGEIDDDNELVDMDYLQEKFDEDIEIPKEIEEEEGVASLFKKDEDNLPARTVKEDIAKIKAKVKQKQQSNPSSVSKETRDTTNEESHSLERNDKLPSISRVYSEKPKILVPSSAQQREKEQKLPNLKLQKNKVVLSTKKTFTDRSSESGDRGGQGLGGGAGAARAVGGGRSSRRDRDDELLSMEILKRREEEILRSKLRREQLLREQEELFAQEDDSGHALGGGPPFNPVTATERRRTKKKKPVKEVTPSPSPGLPHSSSQFLVKYDSRSGLFGVDVEAERSLSPLL